MTSYLFGRPLTNNESTPSTCRHDHLTFRGNIAVGRHGWLRLTPAYSLYMVQKLLAQCKPDELVLDPFSGTGTTSLACASQGIRCHAVDINPFLVWLGNLKLTQFPNIAACTLKTTGNRIADAAFRNAKMNWRPNLHAIEKWWDEATVTALANLYHAIRHPEKIQAPYITDLLCVAFCRVLIRSANVSFGHQSMSFKKHSNECGDSFLAGRIEGATDRIAGLFIAAINEVADSLTIEPPKSDARVFLGDSRNPAEALPDRGYQIIITSPPYPNRMSYIRELRPYMYWLGYLSGNCLPGHWVMLARNGRFDE